MNKRKKEWYADYSLVLGEYGGDTDKARRSYMKALYAEIDQAFDMKREIRAGITLLDIPSQCDILKNIMKNPEAANVIRGISSTRPGEDSRGVNQLLIAGSDSSGHLPSQEWQKASPAIDR